MKSQHKHIPHNNNNVSNNTLVNFEMAEEESSLPLRCLSNEEYIINNIDLDAEDYYAEEPQFDMDWAAGEEEHDSIRERRSPILCLESSETATLIDLNSYQDRDELDYHLFDELLGSLFYDTDSKDTDETSDDETSEEDYSSMRPSFTSISRRSQETFVGSGNGSDDNDDSDNDSDMMSFDMDYEDLVGDDGCRLGTLGFGVSSFNSGQPTERTQAVGPEVVERTYVEEWVQLQFYSE
ncbi:Protein of unknown function [Pyronema omphalodes CBS 100304]|uniref:Uncharacterized protein n=1 Tax=Pyronema omphalodes (strain CBS 100304) TaxID=1076935 RepID=U4LLW9_PYROM|nr:Protein of unknown function [Pyronema omphalodes CBS 100304]